MTRSRTRYRLPLAILACCLAGSVAAQEDESTGMSDLSIGDQMAGMNAPGDLDVSRSLVSEGGIYQVSVESAIEPIAINELHRWTLRLSTADGEPVEGAEFAIGGGMPMHSHGLPTAPRVTADQGNGVYLVEGMKFQMPGHWTVIFDISSDVGQDRVTFNLML